MSNEEKLHQHRVSINGSTMADLKHKPAYRQGRVDRQVKQVLRKKFVALLATTNRGLITN